MVSHLVQLQSWKSQSKKQHTIDSNRPGDVTVFLVMFGSFCFIFPSVLTLRGKRKKYLLSKTGATQALVLLSCSCWKKQQGIEFSGIPLQLSCINKRSLKHQAKALCPRELCISLERSSQGRNAAPELDNLFYTILLVGVTVDKQSNSGANSEKRANSSLNNCTTNSSARRSPAQLLSSLPAGSLESGKDPEKATETQLITYTVTRLPLHCCQQGRKLQRLVLQASSHHPSLQRVTKKIYMVWLWDQKQRLRILTLC